MIFAEKTANDIEWRNLHVLSVGYMMLFVLMKYCEEKGPMSILDVNFLISSENFYISSFIAEENIIKFTLGKLR